MDPQRLIDNVAWFSLLGSQAHWSAGSATARRYATGFSPILGFADPAHPDFAALVPHCAVGEHFYCSGWSGAAPEGWQVDEEAVLIKLVWDAPAPPADATFEMLRLGLAHVPQMLELVAQTKPGPFGPRTVELGELARGETPFLHVMRDNTNPLALYRRMGFRDRREEVVRVVSRAA